MYFSKTWTENLSGSPEKHTPSPHGSTRVLGLLRSLRTARRGEENNKCPDLSVLLGKPSEETKRGNACVRVTLMTNRFRLNMQMRRRKSKIS